MTVDKTPTGEIRAPPRPAAPLMLAPLPTIFTPVIMSATKLDMLLYMELFLS